MSTSLASREYMTAVREPPELEPVRKRLVLVADTHNQHEFNVPAGDIFIHAGDMCCQGTYAELADAAEWITSLPHRHKVIVAGNHDWPFVKRPAAARSLFAKAGVEYLQDGETTIEGIRFYGSPWQPEFFDWAFNVPRGPRIAAIWARIPMGVDVLVTHGPPKGIGDLCSGDRPGCKDLLQRVADVRPRLHCFGHIHDDGGLWTVGDTVFSNVTTREGRRDATVIDFEPATGVVTPLLVPPPLRRVRR